MPRKITKEKFIQAIENNELGLTNQELATSMGISEPYFYDLRKKYRNEIRDLACEMVKQYAGAQIHNLRRNADNGDTKAALAILQMAGIYTPSSRQQIEASVGVMKNAVIMLPPDKPPGAPVDIRNGMIEPGE